MTLTPYSSRPEILRGLLVSRRTLFNPQIPQNLRGDPIVAEIFFEAQFQIGLHGIVPLILQRICFDLVGEAYAATLPDAYKPAPLCHA